MLVRLRIPCHSRVSMCVHGCHVWARLCVCMYGCGEYKSVTTHVYTHTSMSTDRADPTWNNYDCQNFWQVFTGVGVHIKHIFMGVLKFSYKFSSLWTSFQVFKQSASRESLKRSIMTTDKSQDPDVLSPISSVNGFIQTHTCAYISEHTCILVWIQTILEYTYVHNVIELREARWCMKPDAV